MHAQEACCCAQEELAARGNPCGKSTPGACFPLITPGTAMVKETQNQLVILSLDPFFLNGRCRMATTTEVEWDGNRKGSFWGKPAGKEQINYNFLLLWTSKIKWSWMVMAFHWTWQMQIWRRCHWEDNQKSAGESTGTSKPAAPFCSPISALWSLTWGDPFPIQTPKHHVWKALQGSLAKNCCSLCQITMLRSSYKVGNSESPARVQFDKWAQFRSAVLYQQLRVIKPIAKTQTVRLFLK